MRNEFFDFTDTTFSLVAVECQKYDDVLGCYGQKWERVIKPYETSLKVYDVNSFVQGFIRIVREDLTVSDVVKVKGMVFTVECVKNVRDYKHPVLVTYYIEIK